MANRNLWITFTDLETGAEAGVGIREVDGGIGLTISHRGDGDIEALLPHDAVREITQVLNSLNGGTSSD
jgi:hypothetical protein